MTAVTLHCPSIVSCTCICDISASAICRYVSQFTVETYYFADGRCLFRQPQSVIYN